MKGLHSMQFNFILAGTLCTGILSLIVTLIVLIHAHSCRRVLAEVAANQSTRLFGYERILQSTLYVKKRITQLIFLPVLGVMAIGTLVFVGNLIIDIFPGIESTIVSSSM